MCPVCKHWKLCFDLVTRYRDSRRPPIQLQQCNALRFSLFAVARSRAGHEATQCMLSKFDHGFAYCTQCPYILKQIMTSLLGQPLLQEIWIVGSWDYWMTVLKFSHFSAPTKKGLTWAETRLHPCQIHVLYKNFHVKLCDIIQLTIVSDLLQETLCILLQLPSTW